MIDFSIEYAKLFLRKISFERSLNLKNSPIGAFEFQKHFSTLHFIN